MDDKQSKLAQFMFDQKGANPHNRVQGKDVEELIDSSPCAAEYRKLEDCLAEFDRSWKRCQVEVKLLRQCNVQHTDS